MKLIGLTGGIATGKSTVSKWWKAHGVSVIDADKIAREVVKPNTLASYQIKQQFGDEMFFADGTLNRARLGKVIFADDKKRLALDHIMQPIIYQTILERIARCVDAREKFAILDMPLLFEYQYDKLVDEVMVVYVDAHLQLQRLVERNGLTEDEAKQRIQSQWPLEEKIKQADVVIDNNQDLAHLYQQLMNDFERRILCEVPNLSK